MGLDVTAFKGLYLPEPALVEDEDGFIAKPDGSTLTFDEYLKPWENTAFPGSCKGLQTGAIYLHTGREHMWSSSYHSYGNWREQLAKLAEYPMEPYQAYKGATAQLMHVAGAWSSDKGPFWELVNFSDCEGTLGTEVCRKLLRDFIQFEHKAATMRESFQAGYQTWKRTFEFASDNGAVDFG